MTERHKVRCREPSRICSRVKIAIQKNRKIRCLFKRVLGAAEGRLYKFRKRSIRKERVFLKCFVGIPAKKEKKKKEKST